MFVSLKQNDMINRDFTSILDLLNSFPDEQTCIDHLEKLTDMFFILAKRYKELK
jgi:hypothetical protein